MTSREDQQKLEYVKAKGVHHLFELLASKVLTTRPDNVFEFLRQELVKIEEEECKPQHSHDPTRVYIPPGVEGLRCDAGALKITIAVFGLDNAGKTALIASMGGAPDSNTTPTVGYSPSMFSTDKYELCVFDLGGGKNFRGIWTHYYHDVHAVIYVVDSADEARLEEAGEVFRDVMSHPRVEGKPLLVFANKNDKPNARTAEAIKNALKFGNISSKDKRAVSCCAITEDPVIEEGVEWLLNTVAANYDELSALVKKHTEEMKVEKKKRLEEQARRVEELRRAEGRSD